METPVLASPNFDKEFLLETDGSGKGLGAVLAQKQEDGSTQLIAYASLTLELSEKNYGVTEVEALAVVWAVKHFRHYLYGHRCHVYMDHEALKSLMNTPHPSGHLARWGLALQEVKNLHIHCRPDRKNANADALSWNPLEKCELGIVAAIQEDSATAKGGEEDSLSQRQQADSELLEVIKYLELVAFQVMKRKPENWLLQNHSTY